MKGLNINRDIKFRAWNKLEVRFGVRLDAGTLYIIDGGLDELEVIGNTYENPELLK